MPVGENDTTMVITTGSVEPRRRRQRRPQIAHNDTPIAADHHRPVVGRSGHKTTSSRSVALPAPGVTNDRVRQQVYAALAKTGLTKNNPNAAVLAAITYADGALKANSSYCQPLTLTASPQTAAPGTPTTLTATYETGLLSELSSRYRGYAPPDGPYPFTGSFSLKLGTAAPTPTCTTTAGTSTTPAVTTCRTTVRPRTSLTHRATIAVAGTSSPVPVATAKASIIR